MKTKYIIISFFKYFCFEVPYLIDEGYVKHFELVKNYLVVDGRADVKYYYSFGWVIEPVNL